MFNFAQNWTRNTKWLMQIRERIICMIDQYFNIFFTGILIQWVLQIWHKIPIFNAKCGIYTKIFIMECYQGRFYIIMIYYLFYTTEHIISQQLQDVVLSFWYDLQCFFVVLYLRFDDSIDMLFVQTVVNIVVVLNWIWI